MYFIGKLADQDQFWSGSEIVKEAELGRRLTQCSKNKYLREFWSWNDLSELSLVEARDQDFVSLSSAIH